MTPERKTIETTPQNGFMLVHVDGAEQKKPVVSHTVKDWGHCKVCGHDTIPGEGCARNNCPDYPKEKTE